MSIGSIVSGTGKVLFTQWHRMRSPKKSTIAIAIKALVAATEHFLVYLNHKTSEPMERGSEFWDNAPLRNFLMKKYDEDKRFTFHQCDSGQLARDFSPYFILPGHRLDEAEVTSLITSIIDSAKEIFIHTLPNDKKAMAYNQLRDSRLLDFIARDRRRETTELAEIVESLRTETGKKATLVGFRTVSHEKLNKLFRIYVHPAEYHQFYTLLDKLRLLAIVGQPHIGKTTTAYMLAKQLSMNKGCIKIIEASDLDAVKDGNLTSISDTIVIFDDLFGEVVYEYTGPNLKFIKTLIEQNNYVIITSREYIFDEAKLKTKIVDELPQLAPEMLQEGSYPTAQLEKILVNHIQLAKEMGELVSKTETQIYANKNYILNELRFPHNIELFVQNCKVGNEGQIDIRGTIDMSKKISDLVRRIIVQGTEEERRILLLCALLREIKISQLEHLLSVTGHKKDQFHFTINSYRSLMVVDLEQRVMKYKHPSFRESVIEYFEKYDMSIITSITIRLLEAANPAFISLKPLHQIILKMTREMEASVLAQLFMDKDISIKLNTILFGGLLYVDPCAAVETYLHTAAKKHPVRSPVHFTNRKKVEQALDYIADGLKSGTIGCSQRLKQLIFLLLTASIEKIIVIFHALRLNDKAELKFKVTLLTPICQKNPEVGLQEIKNMLTNDIPGHIRLSLYAVLSVFRGAYIPAVMELVEELRSVETNPYGIRRLDRVVRNLTGRES